MSQSFEGKSVLTISSNARLFLYQAPMNMQKSFEGLSAATEQLFPGELLSGAFFIFLNRKRNYVKVLCFDGDGLVIWSKRLERGKFLKKETNTSINRREFFMLLEGVTPKKLNPRFSL